MAKELIYCKYRETDDEVFLLTWSASEAIAAAEKQNSGHVGKENEEVHRTSDSFSSNFIMYGGSGVMMIDAEVVNSFRLIEKCCKPPVLKRFVQANLTGSEKLPSTKKELVLFIRNMLSIGEYGQINYTDAKEDVERSSDAQADKSAKNDRTDDNDSTDDLTSHKRGKTDE